MLTIWIIYLYQKLSFIKSHFPTAAPMLIECEKCLTRFPLPSPHPDTFPLPFALSPIWGGKLSLEMSVSCKQELTLQLRRKIRTDLQTQKRKKEKRIPVELGHANLCSLPQMANMKKQTNREQNKKMLPWQEVNSIVNNAIKNSFKRSINAYSV